MRFVVDAQLPPALARMISELAMKQNMSPISASATRKTHPNGERLIEVR